MKTERVVEHMEKNLRYESKLSEIRNVIGNEKSNWNKIWNEQLMVLNKESQWVSLRAD